MCGLVAYTGSGSARTILQRGLERLEYRGYDSSGLGIITADHEVERLRVIGGAAGLSAALGQRPRLDGRTGVGHTRWATHGGVSVANAHPFTGCGGRLLIALNGIIENHDELRRELEDAGHVFESETDAEVIAHLLDEGPANDLVGDVRRAAARLDGQFAFVVAHVDLPDRIVAHRNGCPLVVATSASGTILASF